MNQEALKNLAQQLVKSPKWRWMPGMRYPDASGGVGAMAWARPGGRVQDGREQYTPRAAAPDLNDPATVGCLRELVREIWGNVWTYPATDRGWYCVVPLTSTSVRRWEEPTEAAALAVAFLAAP